MSRPAFSQHRAAILVGCSATCWVLWALLRPLCHPYADLACGNYSDHFSDMNVARLLATDGADVWRSPLSETGEPLTEDEIAALPGDLRPIGSATRQVDGWPSDKPFVSSFAHLPSLSPPGGLALTAPVAASYHFTSMSFSDANRWLIASFLVYAHLSLYVFFRSLREMRAGAIGFLGAVAVYGETIQFTLQGFSEAAVMGPLILSGLALSRREGLKGIAWFTLAVSLHLRALFFLPLVAYGAYLLLTQKEWRTWTRFTWAVASGTLLLGGLTAWVIWQVQPAISHIPVTNEASLVVLWQPDGLATLYVSASVLLAGVLIWLRAWPDLVLLAWISISFTLLNEAYPWNVVTLLSWFGLPVHGRRPHIVRDVRFAAILFLAVIVLEHGSYPIPEWIQQVV